MKYRAPTATDFRKLELKVGSSSERRFLGRGWKIMWYYESLSNMSHCTGFTAIVLAENNVVLRVVVQYESLHWFYCHCPCQFLASSQALFFILVFFKHFLRTGASLPPKRCMASYWNTIRSTKTLTNLRPRNLRSEELHL